MAKPIQPTPELTGADADAVLHELQHGTRSTPARRRMFALSRQVQTRHLEVMTKDIQNLKVITAGD